MEKKDCKQEWGKMEKGTRKIKKWEGIIRNKGDESEKREKRRTKDRMRIKSKKIYEKRKWIWERREMQK